MKNYFLYFLIIFMIITLCKCKDTQCPSCPNDSEKNIHLKLIETRSLPYNTLVVIDFNKAILYEGKNLIVADISDSNNIQVLSTYELTSEQYYNSIQLGRFIITDKIFAYYQKEIIDIETNDKISIQEVNYDIGKISISPIDFSILYSSDYFDSSMRTVAKIKYILPDQSTKTISDSCHWPQWSPVYNWFTASKVTYHEGRFQYWEQDLFNVSGKKVVLTKDPYGMTEPIWTMDGSALVYDIGDNGMMSVELVWSDAVPKIIRKITQFDLGKPFLWSPDGQYIVYIKWYDGDYLDILGNDILLTDRNLNIRIHLIKHDTTIELPLKWSPDDTLITYTAEWSFGYNHFFPLQLFKYEVLGE